MRPVSASVSACALPGYGTCTSFTPAITLISSPARCVVVATPDEP